MQSNIFKATNEGKGLILLPHDNSEHPIVGACISPRENALDTIQLPGSTLPDWVSEAREAADYDDTLDKVSPPKITNTTGILRPIELQAYGGYNLKVNGEVCPVHPTQGILRNEGKLPPRLYRLVVHEYRGNPLSSFPPLTGGYTTNCCGWLAGLAEITAPEYYIWYKHRYSTDQNVNDWVTWYFGNNMNTSTPHETIPTWVHVGSPVKLWYGPYHKEGPYRDGQPSISASNYIRHTYFTELEYIDDTITASSTISTSDYTPTYDNGVMLWMHSGTLNTGTMYTKDTTATYHLGTHKLTDTLKRDTSKGFMTCTSKGLVVTNELRRNFLRISPTVFKHTGGY